MHFSYCGWQKGTSQNEATSNSAKIRSVALCAWLQASVTKLMCSLPLNVCLGFNPITKHITYEQYCQNPSVYVVQLYNLTELHIQFISEGSVSHINGIRPGFLKLQLFCVLGFNYRALGYSGDSFLISCNNLVLATMSFKLLASFVPCRLRSLYNMLTNSRIYIWYKPHFLSFFQRIQRIMVASL